MKKLLSVLLILVVLAVPALAESPDAAAPTDAGEAFVSERGYSIPLPEGWFLFDKETLESVMELNGEKFVADLGLSEEILDSMAASAIDPFYSSDMQESLNVGISPATGLQTEDILSLESVLQAQYAGLGFKDYHMNGMVEFAGKQYCSASCTAGVAITLYYCVENDMLYTLTFTNVSDTDCALILEGFTVL